MITPVALLTRTKERIQSIFSRRPNLFITRLIEQSLLVQEGTNALTDYMGKPSGKNANSVRDYEKQADEVRRILIDELNRTFVTPIDREDLYALSRAIDDILDYAQSTVDEMEILKVKPNPYLEEMADMLKSSAEEIHLAMERIADHPNVADTHAVRAKSIENRMEKLYAEAIADLFKNPDDLKDVVTMLKLREIYRHMLYAVRSAEQAGNIISDIVIKFY
jgi:predicted phosphate transport protein (TIGR00153 family)